MRIGLISDTHVPGGATEVPSQVATAFEGVDLILHAGNIYRPDTLDWLERIAPVKAAGAIYGDRMESPTAHAMECAGDPRVAQQQVMELEGHRLGVVNNLLMDGFYDELLPGIIAAHNLPEGVLRARVEEYFGDCTGHSGVRTDATRAGGGARGAAVRQPGQPVAAAPDAQAGVGGDSGADGRRSGRRGWLTCGRLDRGHFT